MLSPRFNTNSKSILNLSEIQKNHLKIINDKLIDGQYKLIDNDCICKENENINSRVISQTDRYGINLKTVFCLNCGSLRFNPYLDEESLKNFYKDHYQYFYKRYNDIEKYFKNQEHYALELEKLLKQKDIKFDSIFEIGCGAGGALNYFYRNGLKVGGSEYSEELLNYIKRKNFGEFIKSPEDNFSLNFDIIFMNHVFEHISDPINFLKAIKSKMNKESRIVLTIPDYSRIDKFSYPGGDLLYYIHIAHKFNFSYMSFIYLCKKLSLNLEHVIPSKIKSEYTVILNNMNNISDIKSYKFIEPIEAYKYLFKTERKYKFFLNQGQLINLHIILIRKLYNLIPIFLKNQIKKLLKVL